MCSLPTLRHVTLAVEPAVTEELIRLLRGRRPHSIRFDPSTTPTSRQGLLAICRGPIQCFERKNRVGLFDVQRVHDDREADRCECSGGESTNVSYAAPTLNE